MIEIEKYDWSEWRNFPNPRNKGILVAPFRFGIYQLRNNKNSRFVLFGRGDHLAWRMTSLLPEPDGRGTRSNYDKRNYVKDNIDCIEYRTIACSNHEDTVEIERAIRKLKIHIFNT